MRRHLDMLRAKPHHVRKQIAFAGAFVITFFIFMLWLGYGHGFSSKPTVATTVDISTESAKAPESKNAAVAKDGPMTAAAVGAWESIVSFKDSIMSAFRPHVYEAPADVVEVVK